MRFIDSKIYHELNTDWNEELLPLDRSIRSWLDKFGRHGPNSYFLSLLENYITTLSAFISDLDILKQEEHYEDEDALIGYIQETMLNGIEDLSYFEMVIVDSGWPIQTYTEVRKIIWFNHSLKNALKKELSAEELEERSIGFLLG